MSETMQEVITYPLGDLAGLFRRAGLNAKAAESQSHQLRLCLKMRNELCEARLEAQPHTFFVPGRIEVLGKHTDYAGGRSLVCAVDRGFCFIASERKDRIIRVIDARNSQSLEIDLLADESTSSLAWANYPLTVAHRLRLNFGDLVRGADLVFSSDLPPDSGMSSSSALMIGLFLGISSVNGLSASSIYSQSIQDLEGLAMYLACIENGESYGALTGKRGVGTFGGSEDHIAILCGQRDSLVQYRYAPVAHERTIQMPEDHVFVVAHSGVKANKIEEGTRQKYNRKSLLARTIAEMWREATKGQEPHLGAILNSAPDALERLTELVRANSQAACATEDLLTRLEHFFQESEVIVPEASDALARKDLLRFQELVDRSQELTETLLDNQVPETVFLARSARELGAQAASAFGAGFGGSVWAMVEVDQAECFMEKWRRAYAEAYPVCAERAIFLSCSAGPPTTQIKWRD